LAIDATFDLALNFVSASQEPTGVDQAGIENARLQRVIDSLPDSHYSRALAIGATPALCRKLARYCDALATTPEAERLSAGRLDLVVLCDALAGADEKTRRYIVSQSVSALKPGGHLVLVNWLSADCDAAAFIEAAGDMVLPVSRQRTPHCRVDVLERA
jgi:hypothetical protein